MAEDSTMDTAQQAEPQGAQDSLLTGKQEETGTEAQSAEEKPAEGQQDAKEGEAKTEDQVPETYELTMQEGFSLAEGQQAELDAMFKDMGLTQAQAQKLADYYMNNMGAQQKQAVEAYRKAQEAEVAAAKADAEIGGASLNENLGFAKQAMDKFGGEKFRQELEAHGMGNNAEMIRLLARVGRAMQGDTLVAGTRAGTGKDAAHTLYPNLP